jgi:CRISPR type III-A-associated protein Csm2
MAADMRTIMQKMQSLTSMSDLKVEDYAEEGGLADSFVMVVGRDLKPTQLRKVFHHVKDLQRELQNNPQEQFDRAKVAMVMPLLAYAVGRKLVPPDFYNLMKVAFGAEKCRTQADFDSAANFLEAIMAYHKFHNK